MSHEGKRKRGFSRTIVPEECCNTWGKSIGYVLDDGFYVYRDGKVCDLEHDESIERSLRKAREEKNEHQKIPF
jgi:hypothetical protein